ncbi:MAG: carboxypeptidase-like regulatory domain-containing protein [Granulicella sp.]
MPMRFFLKLLVLLSVGGSAISLVAQFPLKLHGRVVDSEGAAIARAHIFLRADTSGGLTEPSIDRTLTTNSKGFFDLTMSSGFYDLCVFANDFTPTCRKFFIKGNLDQKFQLNVDSEVSKRIADKF